MSKRRLTGILVPNLSTGKIMLSRYLPYRQQAGLIAFTPGQIRQAGKNVRALVYGNGTWQIRRVPLPQAIYNRCFGDKRTLFSRVEKQLGPHTCFNAVNRFDKWTVHELLSQGGLGDYLPETHLYERKRLRTFVHEQGCAFLKPRYGLKGKDIYRLRQDESGDWTLAEDRIYPKFRMKYLAQAILRLEQWMGGKKYIIQKEIKMAKLQDRIVDMRIMTQKNAEGRWTVTAGLVRFAKKHYFVSNVFRMSDTVDNVLAQLYEDPREQALCHDQIRKICVDAAILLEKHYGHLGELGIDIGIDSNGRLWLIEVNGLPSKALFDDVEQADQEAIYRTALQYADYLGRQPHRAARNRRGRKRRKTKRR